MLWKVYIDGRDTGCIESNYAWASAYWQQRARQINAVIKLKRIK